MTRWAWRDGDRLWLHIGLVYRMGTIGAFNYNLSLVQTNLDITYPQRWCLADILRTFLFLGRYSLFLGDSVLASSCGGRDLTVRTGQGRIWRYGSLRIDDNWQRIVIDLHSGGPIFRESLRLADYDGNRMPAPQHLLLCQWRLRTGERVHLGHQERFSGKNGHDSRHG